MRKNLKASSVITIFLVIAAACSKFSDNRMVIDNKQAITPAVTSTLVATPQITPTESKYIFNLFELVGKTPAEVETKIGKPRWAKKADYASSSYDEERQYEIAPIPAPFFLLVRFLQGKAVQFMWAIPPQSGTSEPKELVEKFGFKIDGLEVKDFPNARSWKGTIDGIVFEEIRAIKGNSNYSVLNVIVKK